MDSISENAKAALNLLRKSGFEAYLIGGYARDFAMGKTPHDIDIATSAVPEKIKQVFDGFNVIETGIKHGTVTIILGGEPIEITAYRKESAYSDNRHPDSVEFTDSLKEDTARRDFTMNALALNENSGIVDYHGGLHDIKNRIIRCVGEPNQRFREDALRIIRALRFSSVLDFEIEPQTESAIFKNKALLKNVSAERIYIEFSKMLCGKAIKRVFLRYIDVLAEIIPELAEMKNFNQQNPHHIYTVSEHTATVIENIEPNPRLRFAALFHDIGKPRTFSIDTDGIGHFYSHSEVSAEIADNIMTKLKFDRDSREYIYLLVKRHDAPISPEVKSVKRLMNKFSPKFFFDLVKLQRADNLGLNPEYFYRQRDYDLLESLANKIIAENSCFSLKNLAVNGSDIIKSGVREGKEVGRILNLLLDGVIDGKVKNEKDALLSYISEYIYAISKISD